MSSVTASDRARHTDELRRNREEYQERESEQVKRHKREIRRLNEQHDKDLQGIKEAYEKQLENLRERSYRSLTQKDQQNQEKINELRSLYADQLRKKAEANEQSQKQLRESVRSEIEKKESIHDQQTNRLKLRYEDELRRRDQNYQNVGTENQKAMQEALQKRTQDLNEKHALEINTMAEDRDRRLAMESHKVDQLKSSYEDTLARRELASKQEIARVRDNSHSVLRDSEARFNEIVRSRDEILQSERNDMKKGFQRATENKLEELQSSHDNLRDNVVNRYEKQVRAADHEVNRLKNERLLQDLTNNRVRSLEQKNLVSQYEDRIRDLEQQKGKISEVVNTESRERLQDARRENEQLLSSFNRKNQLDRIITKERHAEDRSRLITEKDQAIVQANSRSDDRVEAIMKHMTEAQKDQIERNQANVNELKESYADQLSKQREAQIKTMNDVYLRMDKRLKEVQSKYENKLKTTVENYENQMEQLEKEHREAMKRTESALTSRMNNREKAHRMDLETQEITFENKIAMLQEEHEKDLEKIERRHQEQMGNLADRLNYYRKRS